MRSLIQNSREQGMQLMDDALMALVEARRILPQDAYQKAQDKPRFEALLPDSG